MTEASDSEIGTPAESDEELPSFGNYVLIRHLGKGGMAEVDLGRVAGPGGVEKMIVVKRIRPEFADNPLYVDMFLDEAKIASVLQHPNIIQIHDVGKIGNQPFIAMEYLRGKNLAEVLMTATQKNVHLPLDFVVGVICSTCEGLHYAHQMCSWDGEPLAIVHRDVSPDNVFVSYDGHVKVVDFGLAKAKHRSTHTQVGVIKGTIGYMAPEQFKAAEIDRRLDVFAAGVVLWELVTGHRLFDSSTTREAWEELNTKPVPSPSKHRQECSVALEAIIRRALHKEPAQRYQSAEALLLDLERVAEQEQLWMSPTRRAVVMEYFFPGRRARALRDVTVIERRPTPLVMSNLESPKGWRRVLGILTNLVKKRPHTALGIIAGLSAALLLVSLVAVLVGGDSVEGSAIDPATASPAAEPAASPGKLDAAQPKATKRPKGKKSTRRKSGRKR